MKTFTLTIAALALSAGAAFAENPNFGVPVDLQDPTQLGVDHTATSSIGTSDFSTKPLPHLMSTPTGASVETSNPAADRFSDASPKVDMGY
ncbi:hypothetical protein ATN84_05110 [Paramesorhizobium deserti]|uniref:Uncharacterized protein n=1 Tax=Paramesorhizobium deserti TaxID=1494590 RepID=A0A135I106_9HYPH|nr:hypothetical protein [Paramesorhizobium deserti]KXF79113.1 hypothetical protein ATN84_05110 [Paramesorhizobium deserti]